MPPNDPYGRQLLEKIAQETDENNKMLKGIRSYIRWARFYSWVKLMIIVGLISVGYFQLRPYFNVIQSGYYSIIETGKAVLNLNAVLNPTSNTGTKRVEFPTNQGIQNLLNKIKLPTEASTSSASR